MTDEQLMNAGRLISQVLHSRSIRARGKVGPVTLTDAQKSELSAAEGGALRELKKIVQEAVG